MGTVAELAALLRELRRRHARGHREPELTYRELAAATGWSHGIVGQYLAGRILPPTDRFDALIRLLGATPAEQGALATARDRVEEARRSTPGAREAVVPGPVPRQLPLDVFGFTGREQQLAALDAALGGEDPGAVRLCVVAGAAGVGKTALAVRWAHRVLDRFPDGQLYVDLRGYDPERPVTAAEALAGLLRGLGVDPAQIPQDLAERAAQYRTALADRRVLVVLDNASGVEQVRPLLPGSSSCAVVVTSRENLAGLVARDGARRLELAALSDEEAAALLRTLIGPRLPADGPVAGALARRCDRLPLALRIAAEFAIANPDMDLAQLAARLRDERQRLDLLDSSDDPRTAVRSVFSWSFRHLSAGAARAFGLIGLHPGREVEEYAVAALAGVDLADARALVAELARAHLIERAGTGAYTMHDLLRAYAVEAVTHAEREPALTRLLDHYRHVTAAALDALYPLERATRPAVAPAASPAPVLSEPEDALAWLDRQRANLVAAAVYAAAHAWPRHSVDLSCLLWRYFEVGGHYQDALAVHEAAVAASASDGYRRADVLANLGGVHWWLGQYQQAREFFGRSLGGYQEAGDAAGQARALARLGVVYERLGDYPTAVKHLREALAIYRQIGNLHGEAAQLVNLGTLHRRLGRYAAAADHQRQAAALFAEIGDRRLEGYAEGNLGAVYSLLGRHAEALAALHTSLVHCRQSADRGGEGSALATIGAVYRRMRHYPEALAHLHRALAISREIGDRSLETETLNMLGETLRGVRRPHSALAHHRAALALTEQTGDRFEQARAREGIGTALHGVGDHAGAIDQWRRALAIYRTLGVPDTSRVKARLTRAEAMAQTSR